MIRFSLLWVVISFCCQAQNGQAQELSPFKRIPLGSPVAVSVNQYGNIVVGDAKGAITLYDTLGSVIQRYAPACVAPVTLLETWQTLKVFAFHREMQSYTLLDRFLTPIVEQSVFTEAAEVQIGYVRLATLANDSQVWIFDDADFSLKKYNPINRQISLRSSLGLILDAANYQLEFIREYQNMLFIVDRNAGILVFDNLGNFKRKIAVKGATFFGFTDNELYLVAENKLLLMHLYTQQKRVLALPSGLSATEAAIVGSTVVFFSKKEIVFCSYLPAGR